ncbi:beta-1,6-glucan boisynthesis protein-like protein [Byssothecium circinans]|uniref:Beta-1,6-glucan boisynthesis protein-like protein n=1 Tax=Byssothecium circinans TaxID=147558 RepID=A0A6A5TA51_9PLEO|nr:beta-1,6-glucan boisynthesis protein-like protein [Byssothecium circinans]KAF1948619.1 beta-1,6-glucan boisynthesis protein-like protein [Byssothecium circinans]
MPRILAPLVLITALSSVVSAGIVFTKPEAGGKSAGGSALSVEWKEGGTGPALSELTSFVLDLCTGSNDAPVVLTSITPSGKFSTGNTAQGRITTDIGDSKPENAYFVRMIATAKTGTLTVYSNRFSMTGMTGKFDDSVLTALKKVSGTTGPATEDKTTGKAADAAVPAGSMYDVEYTMQTGATRYAPMQPIPGTKITKKSAPPLFPTSSVPIAKSHLPIPTIQTTITQSQTHKVSSMANTNAAAPHPTDDMAKFLARWKD